MAEIDVAVGERNEAALSLLVEAMPASAGGAVAAELLVAAGDREGADHALELVIQSEPYGPLAALFGLRQAELGLGAARRLFALDRAVAAAPLFETVRFARLEARARAGQVTGAIADAESLEASAVGTRQRHAVLTRAARLLLDQGYVRDAGRLYERALRYVPNDAQATAGLGRSFVEVGDHRRAVLLFERAIALAERHDTLEVDAVIDLARILAEEMGDRPQAIARVRTVPLDAGRSLEARALEATWRAQIGDVVGASLAYARVRETIELRPPADPKGAAGYLEEAARFEQEVRRDLALAQRHLGLALRLLPQEERIRAAYRKVAAAHAAEVG